MSYVLDTNAVIAVLKDKPDSVRRTLERHLGNRVPVHVSSIAMFELWYGVAKSSRRAENSERLQVFLGGRVELLPFDADDAVVAGEIRATLRARGTPIGPYDLLMAAQALRRGATLVTSNLDEFRRVDGLTVEDWASHTG